VLSKLYWTLLGLWSRLPTYAPLAAAVLTGLGSIAAGHEHEGVQQILQAVAVISGGTAVAAAHRAALRAAGNGADRA
jgi:hypothetical protein